MCRECTREFLKGHNDKSVRRDGDKEEEERRWGEQIEERSVERRMEKKTCVGSDAARLKKAWDVIKERKREETEEEKMRGVHAHSKEM